MTDRSTDERGSTKAEVENTSMSGREERSDDLAQAGLPRAAQRRRWRWRRCSAEPVEFLPRQTGSYFVLRTLTLCLISVIVCVQAALTLNGRSDQGEGRLALWLSRSLGGNGSPHSRPRELTVKLQWDAAGGKTVRQYEEAAMDDDALFSRLTATQAHERRIGRSPGPLVVDADPRVPWTAALAVANLGRKLAVEEVQFVNTRSSR
ncbi:MAG: hypothetical protein SGI72_14870 [Planctomycetota bacterium]|nr:hypothetical protein [Planctomycetota bacterium]